MDKAMKVVALAMVVLMAVVGLSEAQTICKMPAAGLMACRPSVTPPNPPPPNSMCCTALSQADLHCFCTYRNSGVLSSLRIDPKLAMQLPEKCRLPNSPNC